VPCCVPEGALLYAATLCIGGMSKKGLGADVIRGRHSAQSLCAEGGGNHIVICWCLQPDSKCSNSMKGNLEAWDGDAPAVDMSLRADQALRAAAQEDFELYEASESDNEMMEVAGDDTGEGKLFTPSNASLYVQAVQAVQYSYRQSLEFTT